MPSSVLMDNWTLQDAFEFLDGELSGSNYPKLEITNDDRGFVWREVPRDLARFEAACQLMHQLVLADEIWVDAQYMSTWSASKSAQSLRNRGIIVGRPFAQIRGEWIDVRKQIEQRLCVNEGLRQRHEANKQLFGTQSAEFDRALSTILWGGAGMLARSAHMRVPYETHPLRGHLVRECEFIGGPKSAHAQTKVFVETQRAKLFQKADESGFFARLNVPPIVVMIAERAEAAEELIPAALTLREELADLRSWIGQWQGAMTVENVAEMLRYKKTLESVARYLDALSTYGPSGDTSVQVGLSWLKVTMKGGSPLNSLINQFGIRAELNELVLQSPGQNAVSKLIDLVAGRNRHATALQQEIFIGRRVA